MKKNAEKEAGWSSLKQDYKLVKHVGEGSFGAVFLGQYRLTKKMVAIKMIKDFTEYEYATIKVAREILIMKQMSEKVNNKMLHIPRLFDLRATSWEKYDQKTKQSRTVRNIFIIMDFVESDLKNIIANGKRSNFTEEHLQLTMYNILNATAQMHSANVIHRDLKPANVLVDDDCNIKFCDFGIARSLPESCIGQGSGGTKRVRDSIRKLSLSNKYTED